MLSYIIKKLKLWLPVQDILPWKFRTQQQQTPVGIQIDSTAKLPW